MKKTLAYLGTVLCCVLVLFACNRFVTRGLSIFTANTATVTAKAKVLEILKQDTTEYDLGTGNVISSTVTSFRCRTGTTGGGRWWAPRPLTGFPAT